MASAHEAQYAAGAVLSAERKSQSTQTHGEGSNALSHVLLCGIPGESSQDGPHCLPHSSVVAGRVQC